MTRNQKIVVITGAGALILWWLLARRGVASFGANPLGNDAAIAGLPPLTSVPVSISNALSTCKCPETKTTDAPVGDYSQGGFTQASELGPAITPVFVSPAY